MNRKKVTYIISDIDKALAFEWVALHLDRSKIDLSFILLNPDNSQLETFLQKNNLPVRRIKVIGKKSYPLAFFKLLFYLFMHRPHAVHCHLRDAELLGIIAAKICGIKKRIYTRHSSTYNHLYHPKGVKIDQFISKMSTDIIAISKNVKKVLLEMESVPENKVHLIHHGFDLDVFQNKGNPNTLRKKYNIPTTTPIIGVIARYTWWKGYRYSIPAIGKILQQYPGTHLVIANATGNNSEKIKALIKKHIPDHRMTEIPFEKDLPSLYKLFDIYVHVPFDSEVEAFGQTYIEALASGIPSVFTKSGIANEFIKDNYNALVVPYKDEKAIINAIDQLIQSPKLADSLVINGKKSIHQFSLSIFIQKLNSLYIE